jgi:hypothetical protein
MMSRVVLCINLYPELVELPASQTSEALPSQGNFPTLVNLGTFVSSFKNIFSRETVFTLW